MYNNKVTSPHKKQKLFLTKSNYSTHTTFVNYFLYEYENQENHYSSPKPNFNIKIFKKLPY